MRVQRLGLVVVALLLQPVAARAHDHTADFFGGFSFANGSALFGIHNTLGITFPSISHDWSGIADMTLHIGEHDDSDLTRATFLGGVRYSPTGMRLFKNVVSFHALGGVVHDGGTEGNTEPALALGGGYEFLPNGDATSAGWAIRIVSDYVISRGENFARVSAGVVYRIKK